MANALLVAPVVGTISTSTSSAYPASNMQNDEPGLIWKTTSTVANNASVNLDVDVASAVDSFFMQGMGQINEEITITSYPTSGDRTGGTNATVVVAASQYHLSSNRSSDNLKSFKTWTGNANLFFRVNIKNISGSASIFSAWRLFFGLKVQPADNIEVGAQIMIDDRSERRYSRTGRRVIDPTVICPAFQGGWPWLTVAEMRLIRSLMFKNAGSYPVLFVLDNADTAWGEDTMFFGDLEKQLSVGLDNDDLNSFKFSIVSIAP